MLQRLLPGVVQAIEKARDLYRVSAVADDDMLDALVLLAVARGKVGSRPVLHPEKDSNVTRVCQSVESSSPVAERVSRSATARRACVRS